MVESLLQLGADINCISSIYDPEASVTQIAKNQEKDEILELLMRYS